MNSYQLLADNFYKINALEEANAILGWDQQTMLPKGSGDGRAEQMAAIQGMVQDLLTDQRLSELLLSAERDKNLEPWQRANLREMRRVWAHANATPKDLQQALVRARLKCEMAWREARPKNDFKSLRPIWEELLRLTREQAWIKADSLGCKPYEALLDEYEPGLRIKDLDTIFDDLAAFLPKFAQQVMEKQKNQNIPPHLVGKFPIKTQQDLCLKLMKAAGFNFDQGRLDISVHPFCGGVVDDIRITTRYREDDCIQSLMSLLHETGHALYEFGLPKDWRYQPVGKARGMAMHESQSLLIEMQACRSREFMQFLSPQLQQSFPDYAASLTADNLYAWQTQVKPGLIRVEADEVTYPLHIILRYRLEKAMIEGNLEIEDLPAAFNQGMQDLLGITPDSDRDGCLQDVHWPSGAYGYFPTYTLGAMIAAQLFAAAERAVPGLRRDLKEGNFKRLVSFLREAVHQHASFLPTQDLVASATGERLNPNVYKKHLAARYLGEGAL